MQGRIHSALPGPPAVSVALNRGVEGDAALSPRGRSGRESHGISEDLRSIGGGGRRTARLREPIAPWVGTASHSPSLQMSERISWSPQDRDACACLRQAVETELWPCCGWSPGGVSPPFGADGCFAHLGCRGARTPNRAHHSIRHWPAMESERHWVGCRGSDR